MFCFAGQVCCFQTTTTTTTRLKKTIFVGNLHGIMTARYLWCLMEDLFGGAVYAGVDIDKYKYP